MADNNDTNNFALYSWVLASAGVSVKIYNQFGQVTTSLGTSTCAEHKAYRIYLSKYNEKFDDPRYDVYFCDSESEVTQIVSYICENLNIFIPDANEDVLNIYKENIISLDSGELDDVPASAVTRRF